MRTAAEQSISSLSGLESVMEILKENLNMYTAKFVVLYNLLCYLLTWNSSF